MPSCFHKLHPSKIHQQVRGQAYTASDLTDRLEAGQALLEWTLLSFFLSIYTREGSGESCGSSSSMNMGMAGTSPHDAVFCQVIGKHCMAENSCAGESIVAVF